MVTEAVSRRAFLALASLGAGAAALGTLGCAQPLSRTSEASVDESSFQGADWLDSGSAVLEADIVDTRETGVLIVGGGNGGLAAGATAVSLGLDFILCEKSSAVQTTRHWVGGVNTKWHKEAACAIDEGKLLNELTRYASGHCKQDLWKVWIRESGETIEFLDGIMQAAGQNIFLDTEGYDHPTGGTDFYAPPTQHTWYDKTAEKASTFAAITGEISRNQILQEYIESHGSPILFGWELVQIDRDNDGTGAVTGAIFQTPDGCVRVNARQGVLLSTGGYAANPIMVNALSPMVPPSIVMGQYSPNCTGDGIRAALRIGASMDDTAAPMIFDRGFALPGENAGYTGEGEKASFAHLDTRGILIGSEPFMKVNREGRRFFNESCPYDWAANAASKQPGGVLCAIFDSNVAEDALRFQVVGCAKLGTDMLQMGPVDKVFGDFVEQGVLMSADSLEELADKLGLPEEEFVAEVERYNEFFDKQVDEDYGKEAFRLSAIRKPPFYGFWGGGSFLTTLDGLCINENMQVLDGDDSVIEGLYAAGDCAGGMFAGNYPEYIVGNACGRTLTFGRHAIRFIAGDLN